MLFRPPLSLHPSRSTSRALAQAHASPQRSSSSSAPAQDELQMSVYDGFEPTLAEQQLARRILLVTGALAATSSLMDDPILLSERAEPVFATSGLAAPLLADIWNVCDADQRGFLTSSGVCLALRLIAHAQAEAVEGDSVVKMGWLAPAGVPYLAAMDDAPRPSAQGRPVQPLPGSLEATSPAPGKRSTVLGRLGRLLPRDRQRVAPRTNPLVASSSRPRSASPTHEARNLPAAERSPSRGRTPPADDPFADSQQTSQAAPSPPHAVLPPLTDAQRAQYMQLWTDACGGEDGTLDAEVCRGVFLKSRLRFSVLRTVWDIATAHAPEDAPMCAQEFVLAMYLIENLTSGGLAPDALAMLESDVLHCTSVGPAPARMVARTPDVGPRSPSSRSFLRTSPSTTDTPAPPRPAEFEGAVDGTTSSPGFHTRLPARPLPLLPRDATPTTPPAGDAAAYVMPVVPQFTGATVLTVEPPPAYTLEVGEGERSS